MSRGLLLALAFGAVAVGCDRHEPEQKLGLHFPVPGHFPGAPWGVQGASGQQTFTGAAVGGFSASKYLANAAGAGSAIAFAPGSTLWVVMQLSGATGSTCL